MQLCWLELWQLYFGEGVVSGVRVLAVCVARQTHFKRTSNAPQTHLKRASNAFQTRLKRTSNAPQTHLKPSKSWKKTMSKKWFFICLCTFIYLHIPPYTFIYLQIALYTFIYPHVHQNIEYWQNDGQHKIQKWSYLGSQGVPHGQNLACTLVPYPQTFFKLKGPQF